MIYPLCVFMPISLITTFIEIGRKVINRDKSSSLLQYDYAF